MRRGIDYTDATHNLPPNHEGFERLRDIIVYSAARPSRQTRCHPESWVHHTYTGGVRLVTQ